MNAALEAAVARAVAEQPMSNGEIATIPGRLLLADGDGLCYYCAGSDDTAPGEARKKLVEKLRSARRACGAERVRILLTARDSHKGHRYAVGRVKPYQGQREGSRRPKNWAYLREILESWVTDPEEFECEATSIAEADDLFARYAVNHMDVVIYTQDKDMRMVPGWHLNWLTHLLFKLEPGTWRAWHDEVLWGGAWFWSQMLHGDGADNIPGLPFYIDGSIYKSGEKKGQIKEIRCGEASEPVKTLLPKLMSHPHAITHIRPLYESCYDDRWLVEMLEQGILLWMRSDQGSSPFNVCAPGNPLHALTNHELFPAAKQEIMLRIAEATIHESDKTEDHGSSADAPTPAPEAGEQVCDLPTPVPDLGGGAGSRPLDGGSPSRCTPELQCAVGQGGEQLPEVRRPEPVRVSSWARALLAKAC